MSTGTMNPETFPEVLQALGRDWSLEHRSIHAEEYTSRQGDVLTLQEDKWPALNGVFLPIYEPSLEDALSDPENALFIVEKKLLKK